MLTAAFRYPDFVQILNYGCFVFFLSNRVSWLLCGKNHAGQYDFIDYKFAAVFIKLDKLVINCCKRPGIRHTKTSGSKREFIAMLHVN